VFLWIKHGVKKLEPIPHFSHASQPSNLHLVEAEAGIWPGGDSEVCVSVSSLQKWLTRRKQSPSMKATTLSVLWEPPRAPCEIINSLLVLSELTLSWL
jgi:hypothetical protein